jgi:hypothetical protein
MTKLDRKRWSRALAWSGALCLLMISICSSSVRAQPRAVWSATPIGQSNGAVMKMPLKRPVSRSSNLMLSIDTRWSQNYGYRPVEVTISSSKPVTADRRIAVKLYSGWNGNIRVEQEFKLPSGSTSATTTVSVPQYQAGSQFYWWEIRVDGYHDRDLSLKQMDAFTIAQGGYSAMSGIAFLAMTPNVDQRPMVAPNNMEFEVLSLHWMEFPKRWINYSSLDAATLSYDELTSLRQSNHEAFQALRYWVRAGGQLWVNEVGDEFERLPELSQLLTLRASVSENVDLASDSPLERMGDDVSAMAGWHPLRIIDGSPDGQAVTFMDQRTGTTRTVRHPRAIERLQNDPNYSVIGQRFDDPGDKFRSLVEGDSGKWFIEQSLGLGTVRAFRGTNDVSLFQQAKPAANPNVAANNTSEELPHSLSMALDSIGRWSSRHGTAPDDANFSFSDLLVPGMGLAPVTEFQILITLFVVGIGPVNYFLLKRWRRLHLMVLTVPLAAGGVTLALFAYAILTDGFGTTVRANSYTTIDQRTGESACWSRLSYYSGLAPRDGLTMPDDVAVYPIVPDWNASSIDAVVNSKRDLRWTSGEARMSRGWLRSRTPTQYLTVRARTSPMRLELQPVKDRMRAKNSLGTQIEFLIVADQGNKFWSGENLANGSVAFLKPVERLDAVDQFRRIVTARSPEKPDALADANSRSSTYQRRQWMAMRGRYSAYSGSESLDANLANASIASLAGTDGREGLAMPPRSYVAVTTTGPEVVFGMDGVTEEASFHVIVGQW